jgi:hypothetical protein
MAKAIPPRDALGILMSFETIRAQRFPPVLIVERRSLIPSKTSRIFCHHLGTLPIWFFRATVQDRLSNWSANSLSGRGATTTKWQRIRQASRDRNRSP